MAVAATGPQLPPDSTGKVTGAFSFGSAPVIYLPASVLTDTAGNSIDSATSAPAGTERAIIVRPIPSGTQAVSNAGTFATQDSEKVADNAGFTDGTTKVMMAGYIFDEVAGTALTENDAAAARVDSKRATVGVIEDATTRGTRATVKAASTAPLATDPALVVSISPNSPAPGTQLVGDGSGSAATAIAAPAGTERGLIVRAIASGGGFTAQTGTLAAVTGSVTATALGAAGNVTISVFGTYGSTVNNIQYIIEASPDSGTTWVTVSPVREDTGMSETTGYLQNNAIRSWQFAMAGYDQIRFRVTTWAATASGTLSVRFTPGGFVFEPPSSHVPNTRVQFQAVAPGVAFAAADAAIGASIIATRDFVAAAAAATVAVTAGKRLRLTSWTVTVRATSTTAAGGTVRLRVNPSGAAVLGSPLVAALGASLIGTQVAQTATSVEQIFPDGGIELVGLATFTVSHIGIATASVYDVVINGYEY